MVVDGIVDGVIIASVGAIFLTLGFFLKIDDGDDEE